MIRCLFAAVLLMCTIGGAANAAPILYGFELSVGANTSAFGGLNAGDIFQGTVDLDPSLPNLISGDGSLTNLLVNIGSGTFDQNSASSFVFLSASTNYDATPAPFFASDPNGFVDILVRQLTMADGSALWISSGSSNDTTWYALDASGSRVDGSFTIEVSDVPLPGTLALLGLGLVGLGLRQRKAA